MMRRNIVGGSHRQLSLVLVVNQQQLRWQSDDQQGGLSGLKGGSATTGPRGGSFGNLRLAIKSENEANQPRQTRLRSEDGPQSEAPRGRGGDGGYNRPRHQGSGNNVAGAGVDNTNSEAQAHNRVVAESVSTRDPLGGQHHRDYYRDPNTGFTPNFAPRNFGEGGHIEYHHPTDAKFSNLSDAARSALDHQLEKRQHKAKQQRQYLRDTAQSRGQDSEFGVPLGMASEKFEEGGELNNDIPLGLQDFDVNVQNAVSKVSTTPTSGSMVGGWSPLLDSRSSEREGSPSTAELTAADLEGSLAHQHQQRIRSGDEELMKKIQGARAQEEFLERRSKFNQRGKARTLNYDKHNAFWNGPTSPLRPLPPIAAPCTMSEAQKTLRQDSIEKNRALASRVLQRNSVSQSPKLGEDLLEGIVAAQEASANADRRKEEKAFNQAMGMERHSAMVRDDGPDHIKTLQGKNDRRLYDAARTFANEQAKKPKRADEDVYARHNTQHGVDVFTRSGFDIKKRLDLQRKGRKDPQELNTIHYGSPVKQLIDDDVRLRQGARGDRPIEYFQEDIDESSYRLNQSYRDAEGFPMVKQNKLEFLEWELFARYRAHHLQRRQLALQHGLEPKKNETTTERDARREKLDAICEGTLYDPALAPSGSVGDLEVDVSQLRHWFGAYMLPTPTIVDRVNTPDSTMAGLDMALQSDQETGIIDHSENLLSARYLNKLLTIQSFGNRMNRPGQAEELVDRRAPEPVIDHEQSADVLRSFNAKETEMYKHYQAGEIDRFSEKWLAVHKQRRWHPTFKAYGGLVSSLPTVVQTVTLRPLEVGPSSSDGAAAAVQNLTVNYDIFSEQIERSPNSVNVDGKTYAVIPNTHEQLKLVKMELDNGNTVSLTLNQWDHLPLEVAMDPSSGLDPNYYLNNEQGGKYHYHRFNYIETQDAIWEERTYTGDEGWTLAHHADMFTGLVVKARAPINASSSSARGSAIVGDLEAAIVIQWEENSSFNPAPYHAVLRFPNRQATMSVPLKNILVWQCSWAGPGRTVPELTKRPSQGMRRYIDIKNPSGKRPDPHFLDKHCPPKENALASVFNVQALDQWELAMDQPRADNYRPLNLYHRKDLVSDHYIPNLTPWESIAIQEADQPMIKENMRSDISGTPTVFATNRHWYHKPRPHAYVKNSPNEIRDLMEYVDTVTPWKKAQKIRSHHEIRRHAPMPVWNKHYTALHRNSTTLLPSQLFNLDKATGKIKSLRESVESYRVANVDPSWVSM